MTFTSYLLGLAGMNILAAGTWLVSYFKRDVSIVDSIWSIMILLGSVIYVLSAESATMRTAVTARTVVS